MEKNNFDRPILNLPFIKGEIVLLSQETQTTVGAAGGATALPATPTGYVKFIMEGNEFCFPFYAVS